MCLNRNLYKQFIIEIIKLTKQNKIKQNGIKLKEKLLMKLSGLHINDINDNINNIDFLKAKKQKLRNN